MSISIINEYSDARFESAGDGFILNFQKWVVMHLYSLSSTRNGKFWRFPKDMKSLHKNAFKAGWKN